MNKRQVKKRDKKLYKAIYELNKQVAEDLEVEFTEDGILDAYNHVRSNSSFIEQTFSAYRKIVLNK